jgi:hypothetical protein
MVRQLSLVDKTDSGEHIPSSCYKRSFDTWLFRVLCLSIHYCSLRTSPNTLESQHYSRQSRCSGLPSSLPLRLLPAMSPRRGTCCDSLARSWLLSEQILSSTLDRSTLPIFIRLLEVTLSTSPWTQQTTSLSSPSARLAASTRTSRTTGLLSCSSRLRTARTSVYHRYVPLRLDSNSKD